MRIITVETRLRGTTSDLPVKTITMSMRTTCKNDSDVNFFSGFSLLPHSITTNNTCSVNRCTAGRQAVAFSFRTQRRLKKPDPRPVKRFTAPCSRSDAAYKCSYNPDSWRLGQMLIRKHLGLKMESPPENTLICNRQRGVSRADLQALVRKQREVRRQERLQQERIEAERRERIQRNLSATATAASLAAKASIVSTTVPKRRCLSGRTAVTEDQFQTATHVPIQSLIKLSGHSAEREQKLDELLGPEGAVHWSPRALQDLRKVYSNGHSESESTESLPSRLCVSRDRFTPDRKIHNTEIRPSAEPASNALSKAVQATIDVPYSTSDSPRQTFIPNLMNETALGGNMLAMFDGRNCVGSHSHYSVPNPFKSNAPNVPKLHLMTDDRFGPENTDAQEPFVLDADVGVMTHEAVSATSSSCGDISPLAGGQWMRLEAVGASEPELAMEDEVHDEFVDDMGTERIDDFFTRADAVKTLPKHPMIPMARAVNDHAAMEKVAQNTLKRLIYNDPLRFSAVHKRHKTPTRQLQSPSDCAWAQNDQITLEPRVKASSQVHGPTVTDVDHANRGVYHDTYRDTSVANHQESTSRRGSITGAPLNINSASDTSSSTSHAPFNRAGQNDFLLDAAQQAISSTPRRNQLDRVDLSNVEPPRLTAAALALRLSAEMNHLEALASSIQHVADMESLRQYAAAQAETVALAQLLKTQQAAEEGGRIQADLSNPRFRSQSTAVTPEAVAEPVSQSPRSAHFEDVLQAAEKFTQLERRLSEKAAKLEVLHRSCEKRHDSSTSTTSSATSIPVSGRSVNDTFPTGMGRSSGVSDSTPGSRQFNKIRRDASQQSRSPLVSALEVHSASKFSTASTSAGSGHSGPTSISVEAVSTGDDSTMTDRTSIDHDVTLSKSNCTGSSVVPKLELGPDTIRVAQQADSSLSSHRSMRPKVAPKSPNKRYPREIGRYEATTNMQRGSTEASVETEKHEGRYSAKRNDALTKVNSYKAKLPNCISAVCLISRLLNFRTKRSIASNIAIPNADKLRRRPLSHFSGLAERAAMLKCRRERAQKLLALSRSLELEEDEVARLELEALKSVQNKRKSTRSTHGLLSPVTVKSPQNTHSKSHCGQYSSDFTATTRSPSRSHHKKSSAGDFCSTLSSNGAVGRTELSAVQSISSASVVNVASKDQSSDGQSLHTAHVESASVNSQRKQ
ncbi:uncharacterized protein DEA37_0013343 [Paragonimus westermani]|uniref:Uncharacterized protein n=1 Tax=Paragonimus westermani TaxID=34504 RepID=A0A5J4N9R5_9TREM|nr:uncharacterized protein DEA37_0013343 [Paragonimus westermani]